MVFIMSSLQNAVKNFVFGLFGFLLLVLLFISVFGTCKINSDEQISFHWDQPLLHVLFLGLAVGIGTFLSKKKRVRIPSKAFYGGLTACLLAFVFLTQLWPKGDSYLLGEAAAHIVEGNYQDFLKGGYLYNQPHQLTLAYLFAALYRLFGSDYVFLCQAANCFFIAGSYYFLEKFYQKFSGSISKSGFRICSILFFPFLLYSTFVYGTAPGLFLALAACLCLAKYLEEGRFSNAVFAVLLITAAKLLKSNFLIFVIAMAAILAYDFLKKARIRHLAAVGLLVASVFLSGRLVSSYTEHLTGVTSEGGVPPILFVMMGFQEGELGPGWWTGFHELIFLNHGFDVEESAEYGRQMLMESLEKMKDDPAYGAKFMLHKTASQWSEPTYESIWIQQNRKSNTKLPKALESLFGGGRLTECYVFICNLFQSFLYFFTLVFVFGKWKKISALELLLPTVFIGGFLFHLFWEAKGQYTLPYCVCLLPYCVWGFGWLIKRRDRE